MFEIYGVNIITVILSAILVKFAGVLWYNPKLFGSSWAEAQGYDVSKLKVLRSFRDILPLMGGIVNNLITAFVLGKMFLYFNLTSAEGMICFVFWIWLGFIATSHFSGVLWAKKPFKAYLIDIGFFLVAIELMAVIFIIAHRFS